MDVSKKKFRKLSSYLWTRFLEFHFPFFVLLTSSFPLGAKLCWLETNSLFAYNLLAIEIFGYFVFDVNNQRTLTMEQGSEEMVKGDVLMNLREEYKEGLAMGVAKKAELVSTQMGLEAASAEWISQLCKCPSPS